MKNRLILVVIFAGVKLVSLQSGAHPVAFEGSTSFMSYNTAEESEVQVTYSYKYWGSAGVRYFNFRDLNEDIGVTANEFYFAQANFLLKRWNNEGSQGNLYLSGGTGAEKRGKDNFSAQNMEVQADWESRKYYVLANYQQIFREDRDDIKITKLRAGFAPYLGEFQDLNIWFIAEGKKLNEEQTELYQLLRFYHRNVLWEVGAGFDGGWLFNFMVHL